MFPVVPNLCSVVRRRLRRRSWPGRALRLPGEQLEQLATQSVAGDTKCCWRHKVLLAAQRAGGEWTLPFSCSPPCERHQVP